MQTQCPHCETIFRLTEEQLEVAHGKVRCGLCHGVFTASSVDETLTPLLEEQATHDEATSSNDFFVEDTNTEEIETNNLNDTPEQTTDDSHDVLFDDDEDEDNTSSVMPNKYRGYGAQNNPSPLSSLLWSLGIIILLTSLVAEFAWFNRNTLVQNPETEPWISQFCKITRCQLDPIHQPELIEMVNRNVYTHPNIDKALMITATLVNTAPHAQAYPDIKIGFSNVRGQLVTQRTFTPEEYMKMKPEILRLLQPDTPVSFGLEISDPGKQAMTYEFDFL